MNSSRNGHGQVTEAIQFTFHKINSESILCIQVITIPWRSGTNSVTERTIN